MHVLLYIAPASIAAVVAIFGVFITKRLKIADFRQAWINEFRSDISCLISSFLMLKASEEIVKSQNGALTRIRRYISSRPDRFDTEEKKELYYEAAAAKVIARLNLSGESVLKYEEEIIKFSSLIRLRVNSQKKNQTVNEKRLLSLINNLAAERIEKSERRAFCIQKCTGYILKREWEIVKGPTYLKIIYRYVDVNLMKLYKFTCNKFR